MHTNNGILAFDLVHTILDDLAKYVPPFFFKLRLFHLYHMAAYLRA